MFESSCPDHHKTGIISLPLFIICPSFGPNFAPHETCDIRVCVAILKHFAVNRLHVMYFNGEIPADFGARLVYPAIVDWKIAPLSDKWAAWHFQARSRADPEIGAGIGESGAILQNVFATFLNPSLHIFACCLKRQHKAVIGAASAALCAATHSLAFS